jgi:hypothetical protein
VLWRRCWLGENDGVVVLALLAFLQTDAAVRLYPIDDAQRDSGFRSYVGKLRSAVEARDGGALRKLVDEEVVVGPDKDDKGWAKFAAKWRPEDKGGSPLWAVLADLISLGFVREHPTVYLSPYLVWRFPRNLDPSMHLVITRDKAALRESPSVDAPVVARLSFDIVRRLGDGDDKGFVQWAHVETLDGKSGWVNARDAMSPAMPRAQFGQRRGRWLLMGLEAD